jgi:two-component system sensor histidine kinase PhcS
LDRPPSHFSTGADKEGIQRVQHIVSDLRVFTYPLSGGVDRVDLGAVVRTVLRFLGHELDHRKVVVDIPEKTEVLADHNKLIQIFINLLQNAVDALNGKKFGDEIPTIQIVGRTLGDRMTVTVWDNGIGIDPGVIDKIFDPFFTTKEVGRGMGLGLSICYSIINEMKGKITVESLLGKFCEFTIELPLAKTEDTKRLGQHLIR